MTTAMRPFLYFLLILGIYSCNQNPEGKENEESHLGSIEFHATGSESAMPHFEKGMLLLHSFEYEDAATAFQKAQAEDSTMVMAYWGEAMTHNHPLWSAQYYDDAKTVLNRLDTSSTRRIAMASTPLEKNLMEAVEIPFGDGAKAARDSAYCSHMKALHEVYPESHEIGSLYALSLLGSVPARDENVYGRAARIVESIIKENPQHPGALHYLIHSYDDPEHAHLAKSAADRYSLVAPYAGHALHMPSHIYIALGEWDKVISSNIASYDASLKRMETQGLDHNARNLHALHWLMYAYLQKEDYQQAEEILENMKTFHSELSTSRIKAYMISMQATYFAETGHWPQEEVVEVDLTDLNITLKATHWYTKAMSAFQQGDGAVLSTMIDSISNERGQAENELIKSGAKMCSGVSWANQAATREDIQNVTTLELQLRGMLSDLSGNMNEKEKYLREAAAMEDATVKPSFELLAEHLMQSGHTNKAREAYERSLEKAPGRRLSSI
jgi:tetratricopeptide (TPR) repeat protein